MRSVDFYEFVGVIVPGAILLVATGYLVDVGAAKEFLLPTGVGNAVAYLVLAYVTGHLLQALGNWFENIYWKVWRGMPTDWPITRPEYVESEDWKKIIESYFGELYKTGETKEWHHIIGQVRSTIYAANRATRLHIFNGNYGMFRGLVTTELLLMVFAWQSHYNLVFVYGILGVTLILSVARMHRFAIRYARELFANIAELPTKTRMPVVKGEENA
ncbi:MAG: hypothetical protein KKD83_06400 [Chloroflexi bacterium]|nr:hypothetical protein [Chloroflexota bacterium]